MKSEVFLSKFIASNPNLVGGWPTPLKNDGVGQLGLLYIPNMESHKIPWFQSPPTRYSYIYVTSIIIIHY